MSNETIDFNAILAEVQAMPVTKRDPNHNLAITRHGWGHASQLYDVRIPTQYIGKVDENDLITRCDNGTSDLRNDPGKVCHFGGHVEWSNTSYAQVTVYID